MIIDNVTCIVILLLIIGVLWAFGSGVVKMSCGRTNNVDEGYTSHHPNSYYDQGGWIDHPPQVPGRTSLHKHLSSDTTYPLYNEDDPSDEQTIPNINSNNLCQECIGYCQLKLWAGLMKSEKENSDKDYCINHCQLECTTFD